MTLRRRLLLAQVPLAAALVVVGAASLRTVSFRDSSETILKDNYRSVLASQRMGDALDGLDREALLRALSKAEVERAPMLRDWFESELRVQEGNLTEPGEGQLTERLRAAWTAYLAAEREQEDATDKLPAYLGTVQRNSAAVRTALDDVLSLNQDAMVRKSNQARRSAQRLLQLMMVATVGALVFGLIASFALTSRIVSRSRRSRWRCAASARGTSSPGRAPVGRTRSRPCRPSSTPWPTGWRSTARARSATSSRRSRHPRPPSTACRTRSSSWTRKGES